MHPGAVSIWVPIPWRQGLGGGSSSRILFLAYFSQGLIQAGFGALATTSALGGYLQLIAQVAHGAGAILDSTLDILIGNGMTETDEHISLHSA